LANSTQAANLVNRDTRVSDLGFSVSQFTTRMRLIAAAVKTHVSMIIAKLEVNNRVEAATLAVRQNIVARPPDLAT
jgi:DNA-binding NarL/FixJ family response regulator